MSNFLSTIGWVVTYTLAAFGAASLATIIIVGWLTRDHRRWQPVLLAVMRAPSARRLAVPAIRRRIARCWPLLEVVPTTWTDRSLSFLIRRTGATFERKR